MTTRVDGNKKQNKNNNKDIDYVPAAEIKMRSISAETLLKHRLLTSI